MSISGVIKPPADYFKHVYRWDTLMAFYFYGCVTTELLILLCMSMTIVWYDHDWSRVSSRLYYVRRAWCGRSYVLLACFYHLEEEWWKPTLCWFGVALFRLDNVWYSCYLTVTCAVWEACASLMRYRQVLVAQDTSGHSSTLVSFSTFLKCALVRL